MVIWHFRRSGVSLFLSFSAKKSHGKIWGYLALYCTILCFCLRKFSKVATTGDNPIRYVPSQEISLGSLLVADKQLDIEHLTRGRKGELGHVWVNKNCEVNGFQNCSIKRGLCTSDMNTSVW